MDPVNCCVTRDDVCARFLSVIIIIYRPVTSEQANERDKNNIHVYIYEKYKKGKNQGEIKYIM